MQFAKTGRYLLCMPVGIKNVKTQKYKATYKIIFLASSS